MSLLTAPALVAAGLLVLAGAQKVLDPAMTVGALRALGLPSAPMLVRVGAAIEMVLGTSALSTGTSGLWALVAVSYAVFALVVVAAIRKGTMIGSCGCFGREDTPPHWLHVVLDLVLAGVAASVAGSGDVALSSIGDHPATGGLVVALAALGLVVTYAAFVDLPRTLANGRRARGRLR